MEHAAVENLDRNKLINRISILELASVRWPTLQGDKETMFGIMEILARVKFVGQRTRVECVNEHQL